jgi:hypothetical protein
VGEGDVGCVAHGRAQPPRRSRRRRRRRLRHTWERGGRAWLKRQRSFQSRGWNGREVRGHGVSRGGTKFGVKK